MDLDEGETQEEYQEEIDEYAAYVDISYTLTLPSKAKSHMLIQLMEKLIHGMLHTEIKLKLIVFLVQYLQLCML